MAFGRRLLCGSRSSAPAASARSTAPRWRARGRGCVCRARRAPRGDAGERAAHRGRPRRDADPPGLGDRRYRRVSGRSITCCSASNCGMSRPPVRSFGPFIGPDTAVVPVQNGVDAHERLIPILGREAVMGGTAFVTGSIVAPGVVRQTGTYFRHDLRRAGLCDQPARRAAARSVRGGGYRRRAQPRHSGAVMGEIHRRWCRSANVNALTRVPLGQIPRRPRQLEARRGDPARDRCGRPRRRCRPAARCRRARACDDPLDARPSYDFDGNDLLRGNRLELPWFAGKVVELGRKHGIPTPVSGFVYAASEARTPKERRRRLRSG